jgi:hypothetical protein
MPYDLIAISIVAKENVMVGQKVNVIAKVKNASNEDQNVKVVIYANSQVVYNNRVLIKGNRTKDVSFTWTAPGSPQGVNLTVYVDPNEEAKDLDRTNNIQSTYVNVISTADTTCAAADHAGDWNVTYWFISGYPKKTDSYTWTDLDGITHTESYQYTDYTEPIWDSSTIKYTESLGQTVEVNTKQGLSTGPKNRKPSDRESRGSWEIIPWADKHNLNPNEVTRAGYGIEVKVTTNYTTDWENKV